MYIGALGMGLVTHMLVHIYLYELKRMHWRLIGLAYPNEIAT